MEYTQEQVDRMLADAKKGLFTEEEINRRVTAEVDRRVESGIQKGLETQRQKWQEEFEKKAKMTAEELAKEKLKEQETLLRNKELEIAKKSNLLNAKAKLNEAGVPSTQYEKMLEILVTADENQTQANIDNFVGMFNETKTTLETQIKNAYTKVPAPSGSGGGKGISKDEFLKMSYLDKLKIKEENPELYKTLLK